MAGPEVAREGVLLDHVLAPRDKTLLSGWVWRAKCCNDDRQFQIIPCKASSQSWHSLPGSRRFPEGLAQSKPHRDSWAAGAGLAPCPALLLPSHLAGHGLSVQP